MAAESDYMDNGVTERLKEYLAEYPHGTYEPQALYYLAENASEKGNHREALEYASRVVLVLSLIHISCPRVPHGYKGPWNGTGGEPSVDVYKRQR